MVALTKELNLNGRLRGGSRRVFGILLGVAQIAGGVAVTALTGGLAATIVGPALIASGTGGGLLAYKTKEDELTASNYVKESLVNAAASCAGGGVGLGLGKLFKDASVIFKIGMGAIGGVAGEVAAVSTVAAYDTVAEGNIKKPEISATGIIASAASGATGKLVKNVTNPIVEGVKGFTGATVRMLQNSLKAGMKKVVSNGVKGKNLNDGLVEKIFIDGTIGLATHAVKENFGKDPNDSSSDDKKPNDKGPDKGPDKGSNLGLWVHSKSSMSGPRMSTRARETSEIRMTTRETRIAASEVRITENEIRMRSSRSSESTSRSYETVSSNTRGSTLWAYNQIQNPLDESFQSRAEKPKEKKCRWF